MSVTFRTFTGLELELVKSKSVFSLLHLVVERIPESTTRNGSQEVLESVVVGDTGCTGDEIRHEVFELPE